MNFQKLRSVTDSVKIADRANSDVKDKIYSMLERSTYKWLQTHSVPDDALEAEDIVNELYAQMSKVGKGKDESYLDYLAHSGKSDAELGAQVKAFVSRRAQDILSVATKHPVVHASEDYDDDEGGLTLDRAAGPSTDDNEYCPSQLFIDMMSDPNNAPLIEKALSRMDPSERNGYVKWYYTSGRKEYEDQPEFISLMDRFFEPYHIASSDKTSERVKGNPLTPEIKSEISSIIPGAVSEFYSPDGRAANRMIKVSSTSKITQEQAAEITPIIEPLGFSFYKVWRGQAYFKPTVPTADSFDSKKLMSTLSRLGLVTDSVTVENGRVIISASILDSAADNLITLIEKYGH